MTQATRIPALGAAVLSALALAACGGSSSDQTSSAKHRANTTAAIPVCYPVAKDAMATFLGIAPAQIVTARVHGTTGNPECSFTTGSGHHRIMLLADDYMGAQAFFILDRTEEEAQQVFVPTRQVAPPQAVTMGLGADWFPAREQLMATDGLKLITTTVTWNKVSQRRRLALAKAFTRPYIKVTTQGRAAAKLYP